MIRKIFRNGGITTLEEIELVANERQIKIQIQNRNYCFLYLIIKEESVFLGENSLDKVLIGLLTSFLSDKNRNYFSYQGINEMMHVFNLMGPLSSVLGKEESDSGLKLFYVSKDGELSPLILLTEEDKIKWIGEIIEYFTKSVL